MRVGVDIVDVARIALEEKFLDKIANSEERNYIFSYKTDRSQRESCAGLWATKEAVFKLLDLGQDSGVAFKNIELCHEKSGRPYVKLNGIALKKFKELGLKEIEISISHTQIHAVAFAVAN